MLDQAIIWGAFALYLCFLLAVAIHTNRALKKNDGSDGILSATVSWPVLVMTYLASLMSTWVFFAGPGAYYRGGLGYWIAELSYIALFPVVAHFTMNKVWIVNQQMGSGFTTPSDFFYARFKSPALRLILGVIFLACSFPYIASVLIAIAQAAQYATGGAIDYRLAVITIGGIMTAFVCFGGMASAAKADTFQGLLFIALLWAIVASFLIVGFDGSLASAVSSLWNNPETIGFFSLPGPEESTSYIFRFGYPFSCAIGWTIMLPHVFVRAGYFGCDLKAQRRLSFATPILQTVVWTGTMLIGLIGLALTNTMTSSESELIIPYVIQNYVSSANPAWAAALMLGFFVGSAAVGLSTANAFLGVASAIVQSDVLKHTLHRSFSPRGEKVSSRLIVLVLGIGSIVIALDPPSLIFTLIMFSIALVMPLFPILICALYWKRATKQAAVAASLVGVALVLFTYLILNAGNDWYGSLGLAGSTLTMIVASLLTKQDPADGRRFYEALEGGMKRFYETKEP